MLQPVKKRSFAGCTAKRFGSTSIYIAAEARRVKRGGDGCRDNDVASFPMRTKLCSTGRKRIPLIKDHRSGPQCAFFVSTGQNEKGRERERALIAMKTERNGSKVDGDGARWGMKGKERGRGRKREEKEASLFRNVPVGIDSDSGFSDAINGCKIICQPLFCAGTTPFYTMSAITTGVRKKSRML